ncbi:cation:proton antiporter [Flammeovirga yaeyamensis]|uniref:Cation:proton antiporter n=1 Tax=Flammeovirga yaeyamensis TaxID=367791 RepID=A0AAX1N321_9BACT|nr:cation:proton antiporter [Flammeovirga yaeyamensis]MBB3701018.1 putative Kef-type K+ transport protein [Flammeovirga yaeyamensis]NMF38148.1 cation:proton antiporter [Flammeovirga yaeyamensis]QWG01919.1 cation:proton antiporter [Flammeovirga yaeyamensis]
MTTHIIIILSAFIAGYVALKLKFPPLVGFLLTGFLLHYFGIDDTTQIKQLADLGVTLLLFTIGLKLDIKMLIGKHIWLSSLIHNLLSSLYFVAALWALQWMGLSILQDLEIMQLVLIAFALSFSSTVFAIKTLQDKGVMNAVYGSLAIGVLVMQDIFAVVFMTVSSGKIPEVWALLLFTLPLIRPLFFRILDTVEHGEMLVLFGVFMALVVGAGLFSIVGLKADLGALVMGVMMSSHKKASELSKALFNIKELLLVCFFLDIGLTASVTLNALLFAIALVILLPIKGWLYFQVFDRFNFRVRTSVFGSLMLMNYSEFGLIVGGLAYKMGWLPGEMLVSIAIAVSLSFLISAPINNWSNEVYLGLSQFKSESSRLNTMDKMIDIGKAKVLVVGMGRIGSGVYDEMQKQFGDVVLGIEVNDHTVDKQKTEGRNVIQGDAVDSDFWERLKSLNNITLIFFAMPHHHANELGAKQLYKQNFKGMSTAIVEYADQVAPLKEIGVNAVFNVYREAGKGFALHAIEEFQPQKLVVNNPNKKISISL